MAYQIRYTNNSVNKVKKGYPPVYVKYVLGVFAVILIAVILHLQPVQNFMIPGDPEITRAAFHSFTRELREGERFQDAAAVFCRQIIESDVIE